MCSLFTQHPFLTYSWTLSLSFPWYDEIISFLWYLFPSPSFSSCSYLHEWKWKYRLEIWIVFPYNHWVVKLLGSDGIIVCPVLHHHHCSPRTSLPQFSASFTCLNHQWGKLIWWKEVVPGGGLRTMASPEPSALIPSTLELTPNKYTIWLNLASVKPPSPASQQRLHPEAVLHRSGVAAGLGTLCDKPCLWCSSFYW